MNKFSRTNNAKSALDQLAQSCEEWRKIKRNQFESMPIDLQKQISQLIKSRRYSNHKIMQATKINRAKVNELAAKSFDDKPELIPFTLVSKTDPQTGTTAPITQTCKTTGEYLTINLANGDSISVPIGLGESAMHNIIKLFLCCK